MLYSQRKRSAACAAPVRAGEESICGVSASFPPECSQKQARGYPITTAREDGRRTRSHTHTHFRLGCPSTTPSLFGAASAWISCFGFVCLRSRARNRPTNGSLILSAQQLASRLCSYEPFCCCGCQCSVLRPSFHQADDNATIRGRRSVVRSPASHMRITVLPPVLTIYASVYYGYSTRPVTCVVMRSVAQGVGARTAVLFYFKRGLKRVKNVYWVLCMGQRLSGTTRSVVTSYCASCLPVGNTLRTLTTVVVYYRYFRRAASAKSASHGKKILPPQFVCGFSLALFLNPTYASAFFLFRKCGQKLFYE